MDKRIILALLIALACNNKGVIQNDETSDKEGRDTSVAVVNPEIIKQYYQDGALFREINSTNLDGKIYTNDGRLFLKGRFNDTTYTLNGVWEEWDRVENYRRFDLTYVNNIEIGPFTSYRKDGKLYAKGMKMNGVFSDTLKFYDKEGKLFELQLYIPDAKEKNGTKLIKTIYLSKIRSDGTIEKRKGKMYKWEDGESKLIVPEK